MTAAATLTVGGLVRQLEAVSPADLQRLHGRLTSMTLDQAAELVEQGDETDPDVALLWQMRGAFASPGSLALAAWIGSAGGADAGRGRR